MNNENNPVMGALQKKAYDDSIVDSLKKFGYAFIGVNQIDDEDPQPAFIYTVGLHQRGFPDLFLSGNMEQATAMGIINHVIKFWEREGKARTGRINNFLTLADRKTKRAIGLVPCDAEDAIHSHMKELVKRFPDARHKVVQVLWPDEKGYLPTNPNYTDRPDYVQRILAPIER